MTPTFFFLIFEVYVYLFSYSIFFPDTFGGRCGRDHMVVGFTTNCAVSAYHH